MDATDEHLDVIATSLGEHGVSAELLNAVHACRPGHPSNKTTQTPFFNLQFMLAGRPCHSAIPHVQRAWLGAMVANEQER